MNVAAPETIGLDPERLARAYAFLDDAVAADTIPAAALLVARHGQMVAPHVCGRQYLTPDSPPIRPETIFLVASITKPVTATAAMLLVERGKLLLNDRVADHLPEFGSHGKQAVRIRHLLTHTSGLPDMLPDDRALRRRHAPLDEFVRGIYDLELDFAPGTRIQYQSMGLAILGAIVERIEQVSLPEFLRREVFAPLDMPDTGLGAAGLDTSRIAHVRVDEEMRTADWGWNQPYWWNLAAPWGGMFTTVRDLARLMQMFLNGGTLDGVRILSPAAAAEMVRNQTEEMATLSPEMRYQQAWGLGWGIAARRQGGAGWSFFGDMTAPQTFGHSGATGTMAWADPSRDLVCILLTTEPAVNIARLRGSCSNLVSAAAT